MEAENVKREDVLLALRRLAFSRPNAAIELAYQEKPTARAIAAMDLFAVSEFRRSSTGAVELKFIDRVKALEALDAMLGGGNGNDTEEFLRALGSVGEDDDAWQG